MEKLWGKGGRRREEIKKRREEGVGLLLSNPPLH